MLTIAKMPIDAPDGHVIPAHADSADRTLMSVTRTSLSLIAGGCAKSTKNQAGHTYRH